MWGALAGGQERPASPSAPATPPAQNARPAEAKAEAGVQKAQPSATDRTPAVAESPEKPHAIKEVEPPLYYLKDKQGNLQAAPGFRFEDFIELYRLKSQLDAREQKPSYALVRLTATGKTTGDRAELTFQFTIRTTPGQWARVPLRLDQAVLLEPAQADSAAPYVQYEQGGDGYVCWVEGRPEHETVQLTLKAFVPVLQLGDGARVKLFLPRAASSQLKLSVAGATATGKVSAGAALSTPAVTAADRTDFVVDGAAGDFELSWTAAGGTPIGRPGEIECTSAVLVRAGGREIASEATLSVRSHGAPFGRLRVRLPRGAELSPSSEANRGYQTAVLAASGGERTTVEVLLPQPTAGPVEIRLAARRPYDPTKGGEWTDLAGFEVLEAARQWGHVAVATVGDWHVLWGPKSGVRQVDQWPEVLRYEDVVAGFEYFVQPYSLSMRLAPRASHVSVEPEYLVLVDADQTRLEAKWKYLIRGAKRFGLDVKLGDWVFDQVEPENVVAVDGVVAGPNQTLSIPLQQPAVGQLELTIRAHRPVVAGANRLQFSLPQPVADTVGPAGIVIAPADNVELVPDVQAIVGLSRQPLGAAPPPADRRQEPLFYRGEAQRANFAAAFEVHSRSLSADVVTRIDVQPPVAVVEQRIRYTIAYEPLDRLTFLVPHALVGEEGWTVFLDGQPLVATRMPEPAHKQPSEQGLIAMAAALPRATIGHCELTSRATAPLGDAAGGGVLRVPLAMPSDAKLLGNKLTATAAEGLAVQSAQSAWTPIADDPLRSDAGRGKQWAATEAVHLAELTLGRLKRPLPTETVIERLWVQTWLTHSGRQERAVFRFATQQKALALIMPEDAIVGSSPALLDGRAVALTAAADGALSVPLGDEAVGRRRVLELQYHFRDPAWRRGDVRLAFPRLGGDAWIRRFYWQLTTPPHEHALRVGAGLTPESEWSWDRFFWARQPALNQAELEAWSGAAHLAPPAGAANSYVYSGVGRFDDTEVWIVARSWLVLLASGGALVAGLLLIYVRMCRQPVVLLAVCAAVLAAAAQYPEPAALLGQAAVLGVALSVVAAILQRSLRRRRGEYREASQVVFEKGSTQLQPPLAANSPTAAHAAPAASANPEWEV